ncbi:MAG: armadillo/beta-catenin-like repeat-containing protein [Planctomycetota bacterium]
MSPSPTQRVRWAIALTAGTMLCGPAAATAQDAAKGTNVVVRAVLESPRKTPADSFRALMALADLGELELAAPVLKQLIDAKLSDEAKASLVTDFGSARLVRLSRTASLGPNATTFATECLAAAKAAAVDPARLAALVEKLGSTAENARAAALAGLERAGPDGVRYCLEQIADADAATRNRLREALIRLGPLSRDALMAMLDSPDEGLRTQAAWALGKLGDRPSLPLLAAAAATGPADSDPARAAQWAFVQIAGAPTDTLGAKRLLDDALQDARGGVPPSRPDGEGNIAVYWRDESTKVASEPVSLPAPQAGIVHAARLARAKAFIDPSDIASLQTAVVLDLEARSLLEETGVMPPRYEALAREPMTNEQLAAALEEALERRFAGAATAIAVAMGDRGDASPLITGGGKPSPLAQALTAPHPAVRFAALRAVMGLKPASPFPGSSRVAETLIAFAGGGAKRMAVVATPGIERSATLVGYLAGLGVEAELAGTGNAAVKAADSVDLEFVLLDLAILEPNVREPLFRLRRQAASGLAPIALLAPAGRIDEARAIADDHQRVIVFPRPQDAEAVAAIADALGAATPPGWPTAAERGELAEVARGWVRELLEQSPGEGPSFYNLRDRTKALQASLVAGGYTPEAVAARALLGTPESQRELLTAASLGTGSIETRKAAAEAFAKSIDQFGTLLTTTEIQRQYDRYNASEGADAETQGVLGSVLDAIEEK